MHLHTSEKWKDRLDCCALSCPWKSKTWKITNKPSAYPCLSSGGALEAREVDSKPRARVTEMLQCGWKTHQNEEGIALKIVGFLSSSSLWKMWLGRKRLVKCHSSWLKPNMIMKWENCICLCSPTMVTESKASKTAALLFPLKRNGSLIPPWRYWLLPFLMLSSFCHIFFSFLNSLPY